jgi:malate dehydrogenase (oxaloacetate-decarboxylating)(NADP+)
MATTTAVRERKSSAVANSVNGKRGVDLLHDSVLNKATAYTEAERQALGLVGLVPDATESEDLQLRRVLQQLGDKTTDLERFIYLLQLLDNDETLFYRTLMSDPARFLPIVYDPTAYSRSREHHRLGTGVELS